MFAAQVSWSHAFGRVPVLVNTYDGKWVPRPDPVIEYWEERTEPLAGLELVRVGGHMPGSAVARTPDGSLLVGDTIIGTLDPGWVAFQRNLPRRVPMSAVVVRRLVDDLDAYPFDRLYTLGGDVIESGAQDVVRRAARRHIRWVGGEFDHLT